MAIKIDVRSVGPRAKLPGTFVPNLIPASIEPGIRQGIIRSLHLLVRGDVDGLVGLIVVGAGTRIAGEAGRVRHRCVDGVRPKEKVVRAERVARTLRQRTVDAQIFIPLRKDKEDVVIAGTPAVGLLRVRDFVLNITI